MAKTTRKTATPGTAPKPRAATPTPAPKAHTAKASTTATPAPMAAKTVRARTTTPGRTTRKASTVSVALAASDDRPAMASAQPAIAPTHHEIAERAYHIYLRRHGRPGSPDHDWLQAIEELRAERTGLAIR